MIIISVYSLFIYFFEKKSNDDEREPEKTTKKWLIVWKIIIIHNFCETNKTCVLRRTVVRSLRDKIKPSLRLVKNVFFSRV